ncbi:16S rRNA (guanine(527)-N(7))-methyltransferase RsmG [Candidatus Dependentiae bacterium]
MKPKISKVVLSKNKKKIKERDPELVWGDFKLEYGLSDEKLGMFKKYFEMLMEWNKTRNLTALKTLSAVVKQHFKDSLALKDFVEMEKLDSIADVGSGAGFPGLPLKIMFPHLKVLLIEVSQKRGEFLRHVIQELGLKDVAICQLDWRTFLRTTEGNVDLFVTKATFDEVELSRVFRATSGYRESQVVCWVSGEWECEPKVCEFVRRVENYKISKRERKLVWLGLPKN